VAGSPAQTLGATALTGTYSVASAAGAPCDPGNGCTAFMTAVGLPCGPGGLPCNAVGDILGSGLTQGASMYQVPMPNSFLPSMKIPGPWSDPVSPTSQGPWQKTGSPPAGVLEVIAVVPNGTAPLTGWPTVIFGHGLGSSKETVLAIAGQLAQAGFASVAIDFQSHGSRAVPTSNSAALGCAGTCYTPGGTNTGTACDTITPCGTPGQRCLVLAGPPAISVAPTDSPQCYAPFLSPDLATTRDNIRQTVLDLQRLVLATKACGTTACTAAISGTPLAIDGSKMEYIGISLGGIIGSTTVSLAADIKGSVLNVPGMGLFDILENTANLTIRCSLVNSLIDAGVVMGSKFPAQDAACLTDAWKQQPGYLQFSSIGRWVVDPADGANFAFKLAPRRFLIQEVVNDQVVPNIATDREGMLVGLQAATADPFTPLTTTPSMAITMPTPNRNEWLRYPTLPASDVTTGGFGNAFEHASLLRPAAVGPGHCSNNASMPCGTSADCGGANVCIFPGVLGTARVQLDAITYLGANQ
jgi:pimeloyl-ACP methyl ester carboxylesterase